MRSDRTRQYGDARGFTLVELLVAISIVLVLLVVIARIFFEATEAVGSGVSQSDALSNSRAISDQIETDFLKMIGPGGYQPGASADSFAGDPNTGAILVITNHLEKDRRARTPGRGEEDRDLRMDQVYFITRTMGEVGIAPSTTQSFSNNTAAPYALVGYLHAQRMDPVDDYLASDWVLARHALHLHEETGTGFPPIHVNGAYYDSPLVGTSVGPGVPQARYGGVTDSAYFSYDNPLSDAAKSASAGLMFGDPAYGAKLRTDMGNSAYQSEALKFTFAKERIRVNLKPEVHDLSNNADAYKSWEIGQMHAAMAVGVSDFVVQFAADADADGDVDTDGNDRIRWYDMDNPPSFSGGGKSARGGAGYNPSASTSDQWATGGAWVFRHDDYGPDSYWPHMIRIRYRLHDQYGRLGDEGKTGKWFEVVVKVNRP